jgi:ABC-type antimicrobial peptide transport system permease subunit
VLELVMAGAGRLLAAGVGLGLVLTIAAERVLDGVLFGAGALDVPALAAAAAVLTVVSAIAVMGPAMRAARIAPIDALRGE